MVATVFSSQADQGTVSRSLAKHAAAKKPFHLTEVYSLLLQGVYEHQLVLAEQLTERYYAPGNIKRVKQRLKDLVDRHYLDYLQLKTAKGNGPYVYFLGAKGRHYVQDAGGDLKHYYRPAKEKERSYFHLMHALELSDFLVKAHAFVRTTPECFISEMIYDFDLRRKPLKVVVKRRENGMWKEETDEIVADAWLAFLLPDGSRRWLWLEHDRGGASRKKVKDHLRSILAFIQMEGYKTAYSAGGVTVAYTTSAGIYRLEKLRQWTREVLMEQTQLTTHAPSGTTFVDEEDQASSKGSYRNWFLFTTVPPLKSQPLEPKKLFLENVWYHPFGNKPTALFRLQ